MIGRAEARSFLAGKPVGLLWGVGEALRKRLAGDGITLIGELARLDEATLVGRYGKIGRRLHLCARGEDDRPVDPDREAKSMSSEITLDEDLSDPDKLRPILWQLAETVARRMKKAGIAGGGVTLKLKTADFRLLTRARRLNTPTQSPEEMFRAAEPLLAREADGRAFRLIGIGAHDLMEADQVVQSDLFGGIAPSDDKIDKALDAVRDKFGDDALSGGAASARSSCGRDPRRSSKPPRPEETPCPCDAAGLDAIRSNAPSMAEPPGEGRHGPTGKPDPAYQVGRQPVDHRPSPRGRQGGERVMETRRDLCRPHQGIWGGGLELRFRDPDHELHLHRPQAGHRIRGPGQHQKRHRRGARPHSSRSAPTRRGAPGNVIPFPVH